MQVAIEAFQNHDGGWRYGVSGASWTEPTAMALLALIAEGREDSDAVRRGVHWLRSAQSPDGGWPAQPGVPGSTWVGALVGLLPAGLIGLERQRANVDWFLRHTGEDTTWANRVRRWMISGGHYDTGDVEGWSWYPGTAAWVTPTALTIAALQKQSRIFPSSQLESRVRAGQRFLLDRACAGGGWNHGAAQALGYQAKAYPETTGAALVAMAGVKSPVKDAGLKKAAEFLRQCRSAEALGWLRLGLAVNGAAAPAPDGEAPTPRTVVDAALVTMAGAKNPFQA